MFASELVSTHILPLKSTDNLQIAYERMVDYKVSHLPIVNGSDFLGLISEEMIIEQPDYTRLIGSLNLDPRSYIFDYQHAYDIYKVIINENLSLLPVINAQKIFLGNITLKRLIEYGSNLVSAMDRGGILVIESTDLNYSISEITHILESAQTRILSLNVQAISNSTKVLITLKVDKTDLYSDINSLSRYQYQVIYSFGEAVRFDETQERFDSLMNYLNI